MGNINISISGSLGSYTASFAHLEETPMESVYIAAAKWLLDKMVEQQEMEAREP